MTIVLTGVMSNMTDAKLSEKKSVHTHGSKFFHCFISLHLKTVVHELTHFVKQSDYSLY